VANTKASINKNQRKKKAKENI